MSVDQKNDQKEWVKIMQEAKKEGITVEELRAFIRDHETKDKSFQTPAESY